MYAKMNVGMKKDFNLLKENKLLAKNKKFFPRTISIQKIFI